MQLKCCKCGTFFNPWDGRCPCGKPNPFTPEQKQAMYKAGQYVMVAPPVCTWMWTDESWIKYIDACSGWRPEMGWE